MKTADLLEQAVEVIHANQLAYNTEKTYVDWIYRFIFFHKKRHPKEMGGKEIREFLTFLGTEKKASASTQNQALNALVFLYKKVLNIPLDGLGCKYASIENHAPAVFSREEAQEVLSNLNGEFHLMASLLYGSGLRLAECLELRVKDIDFEGHSIIVCGGKENDNHATILPRRLAPQLERQVERARIRLEENMLIRGFSGAAVPEYLAARLPDAPKALAWQYIFPSRRPAVGLQSQKLEQGHLHESCLQKAVKTAVNMTGIHKKASCNTFRHSFAIHLLEDGYDIQIVKELLGHKSVQTTMAYVQVLKRNKFKVRSPIDR